MFNMKEEKKNNEREDIKWKRNCINIFNIRKNEKTETVYLFNNKDNYIAVKNKEGKYGFIDTEGNQKLDFKYNSATDFINGLAIVRNENSDEGIIDSKGNEVVKCGEFSYIYRYNESQNVISTYSNIFIATNDEEQKCLINNKGKVVTQNPYQDIEVDSDLISFENKGTYGLLDVSGKEILISNVKFEVEDTYDSISVLRFDNSNKIINNITGKVLKEAERQLYASIHKYGDYYVVQNQIIIKDNKVVYSGDTDHIISEINEEGIVYLKGIVSWDGYEGHHYGDIYYSLKTNKKILEVSKDNKGRVLNTAVLLNKTVVYQENNELYNIDKNGNKTMISNLNGKTLDKGMGVNIVVLRDDDYKHYFMNIDTKEYIKNIEYNINVMPINIDIYKDLYIIDDIKDILNTNTYIVDSNLKKISDDYVKLNNYLWLNHGELSHTYYLTGKRYILLADKNNKVGLIDNNGNKIIDFKYTGVYNGLTNYIPVLLFMKEDGIDIYDLSKENLILSSSSTGAMLFDNYIKINNEIYNYDGKLIYTE